MKSRIKKWTDEEMKFLEENFPHVEDSELCTILNRGLGSIRSRAWELGLKKGKSLGPMNKVRIAHRANPKLISWKVKFGSYKTAARHRNKEFLLTMEYFVSICSQNCHYCGTLPKAFNAFKDGQRTITRLTEDGVIEGATIYFNGIDRIDSSKGYFPENCLPACTQCNRAKVDKPYQEFIDWINNLVKFRATL